MTARSSRFSVTTLTVAIILLAATVAVASFAIDRWRVRRQDRQIAALKAKLDREGGDPGEHNRLGLHYAATNDRSGALAEMEIASERASADLHFANDVRLWSARFGEYDRSIRFFDRLAAKNPGLPEPQLSLALAYVDKMPDHMTGIVEQSKLSNQSINLLNKVLQNEAAIANEQTRWATLYALGLNHLYWPKTLRHAPLAVASFERCIAFQKTMKPSDTPAYFVLPYIGLGDAHVKSGRHDDARLVWRRAAVQFPEDAHLEARLAISDKRELTKYVDKAREFGVTVDTDMAVLWGRAP